jgi:diaminopimelate decarboxylase
MVEFGKRDGMLLAEDSGLTLDGVSVVELAAEHGTPLFVFSEKRIRDNIARIRNAEGLIGRSIKVCYAAKANPLIGILRAVKDAGSDVEVNSGGELWKALQAGFTGEQIVFNGTSKEVWEIENAINAGIYAIQADSISELTLVAQTAEGLGKRANVSLRLVPEIESGTHSGLQTALLTSKFGMMPDEALGAFAKYKDSPHVDLCGIHLHIGSQNPDVEVYTDAGKMLFDEMYRIHSSTGIKLRHINIGGGFPVNYFENDGPNNLEPHQQEVLSADYDPADAIASAWQEIKGTAQAQNADHLLDEIELLVEPGRSIIADAGLCLTTVRNRKERPLSASAIDNWLLTDAGFNLLLSMETYKWYYHLVSASRPDDPHETEYRVAGPLCDGGDVYFDIDGKGRLPDHRMLPQDVQTGEILALLNCGAYSLSQASQYNGRPLPPVVLLRDNGEAQLIRTRDQLEDLAKNELY